MKSKIKLMTPKDVQEFVKIASAYDYDIDLKSGVVYIDAKSLLGVMTYGLKRELEVVCRSEEVGTFPGKIKKFAVA
ncbi:MAG: HPr family phosphocarrier protein [Lachnospiraceae bacterium]|nr:HPr family phosphocarrier protein [Lachnospiraceae bacterium]